jgi:uncharacterized membrane protein YciS (DUF1049 family)
MMTVILAILFVVGLAWALIVCLLFWVCEIYAEIDEVEIEDDSELY